MLDEDGPVGTRSPYRRSPPPTMLNVTISQSPISVVAQPLTATVGVATAAGTVVATFTDDAGAASDPIDELHGDDRLGRRHADRHRHGRGPGRRPVQRLRSGGRPHLHPARRLRAHGDGQRQRPRHGHRRQPGHRAGFGHHGHIRRPRSPARSRASRSPSRSARFTDTDPTRGRPTSRRRSTGATARRRGRHGQRGSSGSIVPIRPSRPAASSPSRARTPTPRKPRPASRSPSS